MKFTAPIDKNRLALLRLVMWWLVVARLFSAGGDRPLPRRVSRWTSELIHKAEKAAHYLFIAKQAARQKRGKRILPDFDPHDETEQLTLQIIIKRLRALKATLKHLCHHAENLAGAYGANRQTNTGISPVNSSLAMMTNSIVSVLTSRLIQTHPPP